MDANVERVEVIKGPSSVLYGNLEPGGIVNVVTKRPEATASRQAELGGGSHGRLLHFGNTPAHSDEQELDVDVLVVMDQPVPHPGHLLPRDGGIESPNRSRHAFRGLAHDLEGPNDRVERFGVAEGCPRRHRWDPAQPSNRDGLGQDAVAQPRLQRPTHDEVDMGAELLGELILQRNER